MRKLAFPLTLGLLQSCAAIGLDIWISRESHPVGWDTLYVPTAALVCRGINAPAWLLERTVTYFLPMSQVGKAPVMLFRIGLHEYAFTGFVFVLWFVVGALLQNWQTLNIPHTKSARKWLLGVFPASLGIALLGLGVIRLSKPADFNNFVGNILEGALFVIWAAVILGFGISVALREKQPSIMASTTC